VVAITNWKSIRIYIYIWMHWCCVRFFGGREIEIYENAISMWSKNTTNELTYQFINIEVLTLHWSMNNIDNQGEASPGLVQVWYRLLQDWYRLVHDCNKLKFACKLIYVTQKMINILMNLHCTSHIISWKHSIHS
jgi:hypothetical protein